MKIIADEHIPPAFVSALRSMGYDVEAVGDTVRLGAEDQNILDYAREDQRVILTEDSDFQGANPELDLSDHPGILACDTGAKPGDIAAAIQEIDRVSDQLNDSIIFIPKNWI